jgi:hypothetical protein
VTEACAAQDLCSNDPGWSGLEYRPRDPESTVIHRVVVEHLETFLAEAQRRAGENCGVPNFIEGEFRRFLNCGLLAGGFIRLKCDACKHEQLLPLSCKCRAVCHSCAGRRMVERAAHLADNVFSNVRVRQFVLSLPFALRYKLAWDHKLTRAVLGVYTKALEDFYKTRAEQAGLAAPQTGCVTVIQRAGGGLNINVHFHTSMIDGVFTQSESGELEFHPAAQPTDEELAQLVFTIRKRTLKLLESKGISIQDNDDTDFDSLADDYPTLAGIYTASITHRVSLGKRAGMRVIRIGQNPYTEIVYSKGKGHAHTQGFDLHAGEMIRAGDRERLERLLRYLLRPPVAQDRLELREDGKILLELRNRWSDGTTHLLFEPIEFLEKLSAIIPRPHINLIIYSGVLAPNAKWRKQVVNWGRQPASQSEDEIETSKSQKPSSRSLSWAELMMRVFLVDVLCCPNCQGRLRPISIIKEDAVIKKILNHLDLPTELPIPKPSRSPPWQQEFEY